MWLGTHMKCVGSSLTVSGVCQDGAREFAEKRLRLTERLSGEAEKLTGSLEGSNDTVGARWEFAEGIGKLIRNTSGDCRRKTIKLTGRMPEVVELSGG
ncbi:hypothetical protein B296_00031691 [Ensete ventricosum]|uniref:Uncharacterized protein n=1 Tax=Ensete ventricosum TaxID=4639 RepID=A0A426Y8G2_ENSVE|nr:hypothetical protein B296_00031691 [Ensete ventricosum]